MKLHRFFIEEKIEDRDKLIITYKPLINQIKNVFRFTKGDKLIIFDNSGYDFLFQIDECERENVSLGLIGKDKNNVLPKREIYLFASLVKKDNFEWIAQKATELGVSHIIPIFSERSEKKNLNTERIKKIIIEASEQSGRGMLPILCPITELKSALNDYTQIKSISWDPSAIKFVSQDIVDCVGVYIGPEGGWSSKELELFNEYKVNVRSLGPQVLRSETAVVAIISQLVF